MTKVETVGTEVGRTSNGCELRICSPWYRSLPLSSILIEVDVDGERIDDRRISFCVNDSDYALPELAERYDETWFVLDAGKLRIRGIEPGPHEIDFRMGLRIPYLFDEETGDVNIVRSRVQRTIVVPEESVA